MRIFKMETFRLKLLLLVTAAVVCFSFSFGFAQQFDKIYAVTNATIVQGTGKTIENGTILIQDGMIIELGTKIEIPEGTEIIDGTGLNVYPAFIDLQTTLGFLPAQRGNQSQGSTATTSKAPPPIKRKYDTNLRPDQVAIDLIDLSDKKFERARKAGVAAVLTVPSRGVFPGKSSIIFTMGENHQEVSVKSPSYQFIQYRNDGRNYPGTLMGVVSFQNQTMIDARYYSDLESRFAKNPRGMSKPKYDPVLAELFDIASGKEQAIIPVNKENELKRAMKLANEFNIDYVFSGVVEGYRLIDMLKNTKKSMIVSVKYPTPRSTTGYAFNLPIKPFKPVKKKGEKSPKSPTDPTKEIDKRIKAELHGNAATLKSAGIDFVLGSGGSPDSFLKNVRLAVAAGLSEEDALAKMTKEPAEFVGVEDYLGTIEVGKNASIVVSSGNIFDKKTKINYVFVNGNYIEVEKPKVEVEEEVKKEEPKPAVSKTDVAGDWNFTLTSPMGEQTGTLTLKGSGKSLTGTLSLDGMEIELSGSLEGTKIEFTGSIAEANIELTFEGKVEGNNMSGSVDFGAMGSGEWSAEKDTTIIN